MIKNIILILLLNAISTSAQNIEIVSPWLKANILATNTTTNLCAKDLNGNWLKIDQNGDGEIQIAEAMAVSYYADGNLGSVQTFEGLNSFKNLESLSLSYNNVPADLDLSGLNNLKHLFCSQNSIISLNLSGCNALETMSLYANYLTSLDLSATPLLQELDCSNNNLVSLDVSSCPLLHSLACYNNNLVNLNLNNGFNWIPNPDEFNNFYGFGNPNINQICTGASSVSAISNYYQAYTPSVSDCNELGLGELQTDQKAVLYPNPAAEMLNVTFANNSIQLKSTQIFDLTGRKVFDAETSSTQIPVNALTTGTYVLLLTDVDGKTYSQKFIKG